MKTGIPNDDDVSMYRSCRSFSGGCYPYMHFAFLENLKWVAHSIEPPRFVDDDARFELLSTCGSRAADLCILKPAYLFLHKIVVYAVQKHLLCEWEMIQCRKKVDCLDRVFRSLPNPIEILLLFEEKSLIRYTQAGQEDYDIVVEVDRTSTVLSDRLQKKYGRRWC